MTNNEVSVLQYREENQFEALFKERFNSLCNYAYKLLQDQQMAEDSVQQVFAKLWEKRENITIDTSIKSYLYRATYNTCMNELNRNKKIFALEPAHLNTKLSEPADGQTRMGDLEKQINNALKALPEKCRAIFVMSRYEHMKYKEIADVLEISIKTVENQMGKALKMMRVRLSEFISILLILFLS